MLVLTKLTRYTCDIKPGTSTSYYKTNQYGLNSLLIGIYSRESYEYKYYTIRAYGYLSYLYSKYMLDEHRYTINLDYDMGQTTLLRIQDRYEADGTLKKRTIEIEVRTNNIKLNFKRKGDPF